MPFARRLPLMVSLRATARALLVLALFGDLARRSVGAALPQGTQRLPALLARSVLEHQHTVEVIDLVLDHPRLEARCLHEPDLALLIEGAHAHV